MDHSFSFFELHTPDMKKAKEFYGGLFNWRFKDLAATGAPYALAEGGGLQGGIMVDERPMWLTYVSVEDLATSAEKAQKLGGRVLQGRTVVKGHGSFVVIADPAGVPLALWQQGAQS
jgi:predicted enzyme related to lactoylglutathione lyase